MILFMKIFQDMKNIRKRKAASMFTTYFSILNRLPENILEYALIISSSLWLSALLCFEDTSYYPNYVLDYFFVDNGSYWAHEESEEPETYFKLLGPYNGTTQQFISEFNRLEYQSVFDVCEVLDFHLLF